MKAGAIRCDLLIQQGRNSGRGLDKERETLGTQRFQLDSGRRLQPQAQSAANGPAVRQSIVGQALRGKHTRANQVTRFGDLHGPKRYLVSGTKFTDRAIALAERRPQARAFRDHLPGGRQPATQVRSELHDRARGHGTQNVRIDEFQQMLREVRMTGIQLQLYARGEKREAFQQTLDIRVRALQPLYSEARGNTRIRLRELRARLANVLQFPVVVFEQPGIHVYLPLGSLTWTSPDSVLIRVCNTTWWGAGWLHNCASMRKDISGSCARSPSGS